MISRIINHELVFSSSSSVKYIIKNKLKMFDGICVDLEKKAYTFGASVTGGTWLQYFRQ